MERIIAENTVNLSGADVQPVSGTPNYATSGNPFFGIPATVFPAYAWNMVQEELRNIVIAGGLTPDGTSWEQVWQAILASSTFIDVGTANSYVCNPPAGLSVTSLIFGMVINFIPAFTNSGASTMTFGGHSASILRKHPSGAIVAGDITAGEITQLFFDGTNWINFRPAWEAAIDLANVTGVLAVPHGGTGDSTLTAHAVLVGEGTSPVGFASPSTAGVPLLSTGASSDPSFSPLDLTGPGVTNAPGIDVLVIAPGTTSITILAKKARITGVGGGGGGCGTGSSGDAGGGAGSYFVTWLNGLTVGDTLTCAVGAEGAGGGSTSGNGGNGGNTSISSGSQSITTTTAMGGIGATNPHTAGGGTASTGGTAQTVLGFSNGGATGVGGISSQFNPYGDGGSTSLNGAGIPTAFGGGTVANQNGYPGILVVEWVV